MKSSRSTSVDKALNILNCFSEESYSLTLEMISEKSRVPRSTVFRMLTSLKDSGYIRSTKIDGRIWYSLGYTFWEKGHLVHKQFDIREAARKDMILLRNELNLSVQLAVKDGSDAVYVEQFESWRPVRLYPHVGRTAPLYSAACPRILLAFTEDKEKQSLLDIMLYDKYTKNTINDRQQLEYLLEKIKKDGYSTSKGELIEGTLALAVPVFSPSRRETLASLSVIGLEDDFEKPLHIYVDRLQKAARNITAQVNQTS